MHSGLLSGLIFVLASGFLGSAPSQTGGVAYQPASHDMAAFYSILAQATTTPTLQTETTATVAITATATTTNTTPIPAATPAPLPTAVPQSNLQINPFDWNFLTTAPKGPNAVGPFAIVFIILMLALLGAGIYFLLVKRRQWKGTNPVLYKATNRFAPYALWIGGAGIVFVLFRIISLDFFNLRFWLYLIFLLALALGVWIYYWYRTSYPQEIAKYQKTQKAKQYMPSGAKPAARPAQRSAPVPPRTGGGTTGTSTGTGTSVSRPNPQGNKNRKKK